MPDPLVLDTQMHGFDRITAAFVVKGEQTALIETGAKSNVETTISALDSVGVERVDWILVTHIHLDHAGGAGTLATRFPGATIGVHEVGAPHLIDPSKLWASAARIYGERMNQLWGGIDPIDPARIRPLKDGDAVDLGGRALVAVDTPGHASHHHAFFDPERGDLFAGDALGVLVPDAPVVRPATPPPEFDLEAALSSIERVKALRPSALWLTHYGRHDAARNRTVVQTCDEAKTALERWVTWARAARAQGDDGKQVARRMRALVREDLENDLSDDAIARLEQTTSYELNASGLVRYLDKKERRNASG